MKLASFKDVEPYDVLLLDPAWLYYGDQFKDQAAGKHYSMMSNEDIFRLPIRSLCKRRSVIFVWATSPKLDVAMSAIYRWELNFRGVAFVWVKTTQAGKVIHGQGVRPSIVKPTTEYLLAASPMPKGRPLPLRTERMGQVVQSPCESDLRAPDDDDTDVPDEGYPVLAPRPGNVHSKKPDIFRKKIDELYGDVRKLELFARGEGAPGWDTWGNEAL